MNNKNSILLIDPAFDPNASHNCVLLVRIGMDSISYAIIDKETNKVSVVFDEQESDDVAGRLADLFKNDVNLGINFSDIKLGIYTESNISIPNEIYQADDLAYNTQFFAPHRSENVYTNTHPNLGLTSVFSFSKLTDEIIAQHLTPSKKYHSTTALLKLAENCTGNALMLDFSAKSVYVAYLKEKRLAFEHGYEIENEEELSYYLLLMMNLLSLEPKHTHVYLSGIVHQDDKNYACLTQYFSEIQFLNFVDFNLDQQILEDLPSHYYTTLLALDQCV